MVGSQDQRPVGGDLLQNDDGVGGPPGPPGYGQVSAGGRCVRMRDLHSHVYFSRWLDSAFPQVGVDGPSQAGDTNDQAGQRDWVHVGLPCEDQHAYNTGKAALRGIRRHDRYDDHSSLVTSKDAGEPS